MAWMPDASIGNVLGQNVELADQASKFALSQVILKSRFGSGLIC